LTKLNTLISAVLSVNLFYSIKVATLAVHCGKFQAACSSTPPSGFVPVLYFLQTKMKMAVMSYFKDIMLQNRFLPAYIGRAYSASPYLLAIFKGP